MKGRWSARIAELRAELTVLYAAHRALADRVVSIERRARGADVLKPVAAAEPVAKPELERANSEQPTAEPRVVAPHAMGASGPDEGS